MTSLLLTRLMNRITELRSYLADRPDDGYSTEAIAVTALVVLLAIAAIGVIAAKVLARAKGINLDG